jgi:hypothetical protein
VDQLDLDLRAPLFAVDRLMTYWLYRQLVRCDWWATLGNDNGREDGSGDQSDEDF